MKIWIKDGQFIELTNEQIKALGVDDLAAYFTDLNKSRMDALASKVNANASKEEIEGLKKSFNEAIEKQSSELNAILKEQGLVIAKLRGGLNNSTIKTLKEFLNDNKEVFVKSFKDRRADSIELKVAGVMAVATNAGAGTTTEELVPGISIQSRNIPQILTMISRGSTSSELKKWVEMVNRDGGATNIGENTTYTLEDFDLVINDENCKKIAGRVVCVDEILEDIDGMTSTIENELMASLMNQLSNQVVNGTGATVYLKGIDTYSTAFSVAGTILENTIPTPTYSDCIRAAVSQIRSNKVIGMTTESYAKPNMVLVHPTVSAFMDMEKDKNGNYIMVPFKSSNGDTVVAKCAVVECDDISDDDTFYVLDGSRFHLDAYTKHPIKLEWGFGTGDWENGRVTLRVSGRWVAWCRDNEKASIIKGSFASAISDLGTPAL